jgi:hypothetical protein
MEHDDADLYFESVERIRAQLKGRLGLELDERDSAAIDTAILAAVRAGYRDGVVAADFAVEADTSIPRTCSSCGTPLPPRAPTQLHIDHDRDPWAVWDERFGGAPRS